MMNYVFAYENFRSIYDNYEKFTINNYIKIHLLIVDFYPIIINTLIVKFGRKNLRANLPLSFSATAAALREEKLLNGSN